MISRQDSYLLLDVERGDGGDGVDAGLDLFLLVQTVLSPSLLTLYSSLPLVV